MLKRSSILNHYQQIIAMAILSPATSEVSSRSSLAANWSWSPWSGLPRCVLRSRENTGRFALSCPSFLISWCIAFCWTLLIACAVVNLLYMERR